MKRISIIAALLLCLSMQAIAQQPAKRLAPLPPMGWMTWNLFGERINEQVLRQMADAMVDCGMVEAGYNYIMIDDGWQGGRDNRNNMIPDPVKFPSGIKALADYMHSKGIKLGIYSDASQLTCAGYTASLGFEQQDARTFAAWGIDYLKYDYCGAPKDVETAKARYQTMAEALKASGRDIVFGACEWGDRQPWMWASAAGADLWRTTHDVRDKWTRKVDNKGLGILDIIEQNLDLYQYAGKDKGWNDMDMLVVGLRGKSGPSSDLGGTGCTEEEYRTQFSFYALLCSPLIATNDLRNMDRQTLEILTNSEMTAIHQDALGQPAKPLQSDQQWIVVAKPLSDGSTAVAILNKGDKQAEYTFALEELGLKKANIKNVWTGESKTVRKSWRGKIDSHATTVLIIK